MVARISRCFGSIRIPCIARGFHENRITELGYGLIDRTNYLPASLYAHSRRHESPGGSISRTSSNALDNASVLKTEPERIHEIQRIIVDIRIEVCTARYPHGVGLQEAAQIRRIVSCAHIVEARLGVVAVASEAVGENVSRTRSSELAIRVRKGTRLAGQSSGHAATQHIVVIVLYRFRLRARRRRDGRHGQPARPSH